MEYSKQVTPHLWRNCAICYFSQVFFINKSWDITNFTILFTSNKAVCITISRPFNLYHANVETSGEIATLQYQWTCQNQLVCIISISHPCNLCHTNVETSSEFATLQNQWKYQSQSFKSPECICICIITIF